MQYFGLETLVFRKRFKSPCGRLKPEGGQMIDPNTKKTLIPGQIDLGHKTGEEWSKRKEMHKKQGSTRKEVIEAENNPNIYQYEDRSSNRSHKYEKKN
jgi:hypothetical protein